MSRAWSSAAECRLQPRFISALPCPACFPCNLPSAVVRADPAALVQVKRSAPSRSIRKKARSAASKRRVSAKPTHQTPSYNLADYRIGASREPGKWPGPGVPFLDPEPHELAPYGDGGAWPARRGEPMPDVDWERDFGGVLPDYLQELHDDLARTDFRELAFPGMGVEIFVNGSAGGTGYDPAFLDQLALDEELWGAARSGQLHKAMQALARGANPRAADPREGGKTALHLAADGGHAPVITLLVKTAPPRRVRGSGGAWLREGVRGEDGARWTPLHYAARSGHAGVARQLVSLGADVNATCSGDFTPLHWAAARGHLETVQALVDLGRRSPETPANSARRALGARARPRLS